MKRKLKEIKGSIKNINSDLTSFLEGQKKFLSLASEKIAEALKFPDSLAALVIKAEDFLKIYEQELEIVKESVEGELKEIKRLAIGSKNKEKVFKIVERISFDLEDTITAQTQSLDSLIKMLHEVQSSPGLISDLEKMVGLPSKIFEEIESQPGLIRNELDTIESYMQDSYSSPSSLIDTFWKIIESLGCTTTDPLEPDTMLSGDNEREGGSDE